ncbi:alcohol dehydrogenase (plasmid) [Chondrocystis sp. NIES-4102]|nr:alcohol dehydrogenase [Chondrocystis sp. NIES-4102]
MRAMVLNKLGQPLQMTELPILIPEPQQVLLKVHVCGVCRTDLHIVDGELARPKLPLILGHQIVGTIVKTGKQANKYALGTRVGVPWLGHTCGCCPYCLASKENLCDRALFTGYDLNGGYAEYAVADESFCFPIPQSFSDLQAAPLLCAGLIGYRSYRLTEDAQKIGFYGFGAAAHILVQLANYQGKQVYAFTRPKDTQGQEFARYLGAVWAGNSEELPPEKLDAAIIFAPVGNLVPAALKAVAKGGIVVCAGIHMSNIPSFPYQILWEERVLRSVANLTRRDGEEFLAIASQVPIHTEVTAFELAQTNEALDALRTGKIKGAAVITID